MLAQPTKIWPTNLAYSWRAFGKQVNEIEKYLVYLWQILSPFCKCGQLSWHVLSSVRNSPICLFVCWSTYPLKSRSSVCLPTGSHTAPFAKLRFNNKCSDEPLLTFTHHFKLWRKKSIETNSKFRVLFIYISGTDDELIKTGLQFIPYWPPFAPPLSQFRRESRDFSVITTIISWSSTVLWKLE